MIYPSAGRGLYGEANGWGYGLVWYVLLLLGSATLFFVDPAPWIPAGAGLLRLAFAIGRRFADLTLPWANPDVRSVAALLLSGAWLGASLGVFVGLWRVHHHKDAARLGLAILLGGALLLEASPPTIAFTRRQVIIMEVRAVARAARKDAEGDRERRLDALSVARAAHELELEMRQEAAERLAQAVAERQQQAHERRARREARWQRREQDALLALKEARRQALSKATQQMEDEARQKVEALRLAREEAERLAREEAERLAREEAELLAQQEAERLAREEAELLARQEAERLARQEAERLARQEAAQVTAAPTPGVQGPGAEEPWSFWQFVDDVIAWFTEEEGVGGTPGAPPSATAVEYALAIAPAGRYTIGSPRDEPDRLPNESICQTTWPHPIAAGETEVTQALYQAVMGVQPSDCQAGCAADLPVQNVSWFDAVLFANRLSEQLGLQPAYRILDGETGPRVRWDPTAEGYRLPTEAEWEALARAGLADRFAGSDDPSQVAWHETNSGKSPHAVAELSPNAWGLHDMSGNVWEWTWDVYGTNILCGGEPSRMDDGPNRVARGGGFISAVYDTRSARRRPLSAQLRSRDVGFRVVRSLQSEEPRTWTSANLLLNEHAPSGDLPSPSE